MSNFPRIWDRARERKIIGETKVSWLVEPDAQCLDPEKVSKKNPNKGHDSPHWFFDEVERDSEVWADRNWYKIKNALGDWSRVVDAATLRKIADLIGYDVERGKVGKV